MSQRSSHTKKDVHLSKDEEKSARHKKSRSLDTNTPYSQVPTYRGSSNRDQSQVFGTYPRPISTRSVSVPYSYEGETVSTERGTTRSVHVPTQRTSDFLYGSGLHDTGPYRSASVPPQHATGHSTWGVDPYQSQKSFFLGGKDVSSTSSQFANLSLDPPSFGGVSSLHKPSLREPLVLGLDPPQLGSSPAGLSQPGLSPAGVGGMREGVRDGPVQSDFFKLMERNPVIFAPTPPKFLQPKCTMTITGELNENLIRTSKFFADNRIDFKFLEETPGTQERCCMFECVAYDSCNSLRLHVYFYSLDKPNTYLVEFMRRMGDCVHFSTIMSKARSFFEDNTASSQSTPMDALPIKGPHDDSTRQAVMTLKGMVESRYLDVKYEGIRGLAQMSQKDENVSIMAESGCVDLFVDNLDSDVTNVHRCAVTGVANLACKPTEASATVYKQRGVPALLKLIATSNTLEVIRESARALEIICLKLGAQYFCSRDIFDGVSKLLQTPDAVVYGYGTSLSKALERPASIP